MTPARGVGFVVFLGLSAVSFVPAAHAQSAANLQTQIDAHNQQINSLEADIAAYQRQLDALGAKKNTLQSTISSLTLSQKQLAVKIRVTQNKIDSANLQIRELTLSMGDKETAIAADQIAIGKALQSVAENDQSPFIAMLISSNSLREAWQSADEVIQFNRALAGNISDLRAVRTTLAANRDQITAAKTNLVSLQSQLTAQNRSLIASKAAEQQLLAQTKNSESNYQKLLARAQAELASFSTFTAAAGGSKLLANQTVCDAWGCYYNQRDTLWGNVPLNGTKYRLASDGCLVTAMAMVLTHYGYRDVTPLTINSNPSNFAVYYPALLLFTTYVDGITATRVASTIDATLATGNPVIVGLRAYGGTHFVVLVSGRRGNYVMRDPYVANGNDISFSSHYAVRNIYAVDKVIIRK
ncbi:MAG: hypothetical protein ACYCPH_01660 [Minisyncoccota bacterium]